MKNLTELKLAMWNSEEIGVDFKIWNLNITDSSTLLY